ncbi:Uncharacterised protein [Peptostreptococcus anaerobius]|uniref:Uncharacterized protein n=1 Tax=Peptostreptococcus anaerobius TaxID=1261 RepID=A0A379CJ68_9FIRM|nr:MULTISPECIES: hypothetical protein [Peptostreptococcus]MDU5350033.1 hypothetical protein [Peptostreptococcus sp.]MDU5891523.1 hypothetical protein [Peptostreptococcus sp.]SFM86775.1 hypothetical protein SAMN05660467_00640 [Peptostreptococcus anaerobius]SUB62144.1 Uncharacterised protein [Peptostreptococcus anaerobius]
MDLNKDIYLQVVLEKLKRIDDENLLLNALLIQKENRIKELEADLESYNIMEKDSDNKTK